MTGWLSSVESTEVDDVNPWRHQLLALFRGRGPFRDLAALLALLGFLFTSTTPGLALVTDGGSRLGVNGPLGVYVCHVKGGVELIVPPGEQAPDQDDGCCLICQAAQLAHGAVPPQHFTLPTESAVRARVVIDARSSFTDGSFRCPQARAPPAV